MMKKFYRVVVDLILLVTALDMGLLNYFRYSNKGGIHGAMESWFNIPKAQYSMIIAVGFIISAIGILIGIRDYRDRLNNQNSLVLKTVFLIGIVCIEVFFYTNSGKG